MLGCPPSPPPPGGGLKRSLLLTQAALKIGWKGWKGSFPRLGNLRAFVEANPELFTLDGQGSLMSKSLDTRLPTL